MPLTIEQTKTLATTNIEKALTVFQGMGERDADLATKYIHPTKYEEHNPAVADGIEGLKAYIAGIPQENHHIKIVRTFHDGAYVFTQEDGELLGQNTFFDVFKFEEGLIVEHWVFSAKSAPPNKSGHKQIDGPTEAKDNQDTEKNKSLVRDYYETVHIGETIVKYRNIFPAMYAFATNPMSAMESRHLYTILRS